MSRRRTKCTLGPDFNFHQNVTSKVLKENATAIDREGNEVDLEFFCLQVRSINRSIVGSQNGEY